MAKNAEDKQKWLDAILKEREQRESKYKHIPFFEQLCLITNYQIKPLQVSDFMIHGAATVLI